MKVALLGATGFVGSALLKEALDRGHVVTAIVWHPEKLEKRDGLTAKAGDVYDTASLATLIRGNEAIMRAFNPGWKNPNLMTTRFEEQHPSSPRLRRRQSKGCSGWAERVGWRSNLESVLSTARICRSG
jgi:putative NADH-flavin reductase